MLHQQEILLQQQTATFWRKKGKGLSTNYKNLHDTQVKIIITYNWLTAFFNDKLSTHRRRQGIDTIQGK